MESIADSSRTWIPWSGAHPFALLGSVLGSLALPGVSPAAMTITGRSESNRGWSVSYDWSGRLSLHVLILWALWNAHAMFFFLSILGSCIHHVLHVLPRVMRPTFIALALTTATAPMFVTASVSKPFRLSRCCMNDILPGTPRLGVALRIASSREEVHPVLSRGF